MVARTDIASCTLGLVVLLACALPLHSQTFVEGGGGWNYMATGTPDRVYRRSLSPTGFNLRASVGRVLTSRVAVRLDAFTLLQMERKVRVQFVPPCPPPGCSDVPQGALDDGRVVGGAANARLNIDPRGIFYVIGGVALFHNNELHLGVTAGAGIAVPVGARVRAFAEARWLGPLSSRAVTRSVVPITFGLRY